MTSQRDRKKAIHRYAAEHQIGYSAARAHFESQTEISTSDLICSVVAAEQRRAVLLEESEDSRFPTVSVLVERMDDDTVWLVVKNGAALTSMRRSAIFEVPFDSGLQYTSMGDDMLMQTTAGGSSVEEMSLLFDKIRDTLLADEFDVEKAAFHLGSIKGVNVNTAEMDEEDMSLLMEYSALRLYDRWTIEEDRSGYFLSLAVQTRDGVRYVRGGSIGKDRADDGELVLRDFASTEGFAFDFYVECFDVDAIATALEERAPEALSTLVVLRDDYTLRLVVAEKSFEVLESAMSALAGFLRSPSDERDA